MTETQVKPLSAYFAEIVSDCAQYCELGGCDRDGYDYCTNGISFENEDYMIEGSYDAAADLIDDGDGYWTPRTTIAKNASVIVKEL